MILFGSYVSIIIIRHITWLDNGHLYIHGIVFIIKRTIFIFFSNDVLYFLKNNFEFEVSSKGWLLGSEVAHFRILNQF